MTTSRFVILLGVATAVPAAAQSFQCVDLTPPGYLEAFFRGAGGRFAVGNGSVPIEFPGFPDARSVRALVYDAEGGVIALDPAGNFSGSFGLSAGGEQQVGFGFTSGENMALLWTGTPNSTVSLATAGTIATVANGTDGTTQVGYAITPSSNGSARAFVWKSTAASGRPLLQPPGFESSIASAIRGGAIVGTGEDADFFQAGLYWANENAAPVVVRPAGFDETRLVAVDGAQVFGSGFGSATSSQRHAFIWNVNDIENGLDLHPDNPRYTFSTVDAASGGVQVGIVAFENEAFESVEHAAWWAGSSATFIDLHGAVEQTLGPAFRFSQATGIDQFGNIYGTANDGAGSFRAVQWRLVTSGCNDADLAEVFGVLDINDILVFAAAFGANDLAADFFDDEVLDINDVLAFAATFNAGCP